MMKTQSLMRKNVSGVYFGGHEYWDLSRIATGTLNGKSVTSGGERKYFGVDCYVRPRKKNVSS